MTAPERGVGRTLVHPGGVEVTDAAALAVLCTFRDLLPLDADSRRTLRRDGPPGFVEGFDAAVAALDEVIATHQASIAIEDAALDVGTGGA